MCQLSNGGFTEFELLHLKWNALSLRKEARTKHDINFFFNLGYLMERVFPVKLKLTAMEFNYGMLSILAALK